MAFLGKLAATAFLFLALTTFLPAHIFVGGPAIPLGAAVQQFVEIVGAITFPLLVIALAIIGWPAQVMLHFAGLSWTLESVIRILNGGIHGPADILGLLLAAAPLALGAAVWITAISQALYRIGIFNPFWRMDAPRRRILLAIVRVQEIIDSWSFGKGASANWATYLEKRAHDYRRNDIFLGRAPLPFAGAGLAPIGLEPKKHMVTIAGTGSGKSSGAIITNLLMYDGPVLCIDPKGELARVTAMPRFERLGQEVLVVDPYGCVGEGWESACYNVFDDLAAAVEENPDVAVSYASKIAQALVKPMSERDPYWDQAAETFLKGLILYIFVHEPKERQTLIRLRELLTLGDVEGYQEAVSRGDISGNRDDVDELDVLLAKMFAAKDGPYGHVIAAAAKSVNKMGPNQRGSVLSSADEHTAFFDFPQIRKISGRSDFLLRDLKNKKMTVYICLPVSEATGKVGRWLRMYSMLFIDMMQRSSKAPKPPILFIIDEFPSLGNIEGIRSVAPLLRSYGVRFWAVGQDLEQFRTTYPDSWGGFIGNAEAVQFMSVTHSETVEWVSARLGSHEVLKDKARVEKPLLDPDQVGRLLAPEGRTQIIWRGAHRPMLLKIAPYYEYLPSWYYEPDSNFEETPTRRFWRWAMGYSS